MRFIIAVDLEGVACAAAPAEGTLEAAFNIEAIRLQATREANAAATALFDRGAREVTVWDNHGRGNSLRHEALDPRCHIALGSAAGPRFPGLAEDCDGVLLIGYHAMEGTPDATMAHTFSSVTYRYVRIDGVDYGEIGIDAMIAGAVGVPVILVSSDDKGCLEAKKMLPWAELVETKRSLAYTRVVSLHPQAAADAIGEAAGRAVNRLAQMRPMTQAGPVALELSYKTPALAARSRLIDHQGNPFRAVDAYTRAGTIRDITLVPYYL